MEHVPRDVLSGLSGGSQNTSSVRVARNTHGNVKMYVENTIFLLIMSVKAKTTYDGASSGSSLLSAVLKKKEQNGLNNIFEVSLNYTKLATLPTRLTRGRAK